MQALYPLFFTLITAIVGAADVLSVASLLFLLGAAAVARRRAVFPEFCSPPLRLAVIIPAHNEELVLAGTLDSLRRQDYPADLFEIVVVADNCADRTAEIARAHGVTVLERKNLQQRGKGYALNHALDRLLAHPISFDGFLIVDADTWADPNFLNAMSRRLASSQDSRGYSVWQGRYGVLNGEEGWRAALMSGAFDLVNHVQPLGRDWLGLSVGLKGNGMAFSRALAAETRWNGGSLTEDLDFGLELARRFHLRVAYAPEARVRAQMPTGSDQAASQRARWEGGRWRSVRERALPLLLDGLHKRRLLLWDCGWELLLPPLAELGALLVAWAALISLGTATHWLPYPLAWGFAFALTALGLVVYVLGGLRLSGAPSAAYAALLRAPFYAVWKFALLGGKLARKRQSQAGIAAEEWVRTGRAPLPSAPITPEAQSEAQSEPELTEARPQ